jgi:FtsP/CotA-like multicopper oxidase with cupredoxin domain
MINGEVFPDITVQSLVLGRFGIVEVRNLSATEHPFHLHGMAFEVLSVDGVPPVYRQMEDTINVDTHQVVRLGVWADNPGDWMAHCHILPHEHEGMMTVLRVE